MFSLKNYNTFGIDVKAKEFTSVSDFNQLREVLSKYRDQPLFIISGGSNMLLTKDIEQPVIHINTKGIKIEKQDDDFVWITAQAGENWHEFVLWTIENNFGGIENMSLIPGNIGSAPIQNIGAYGVELKDVFEFCQVIDVNTLETKFLYKEECNFGYRESIFKSKEKGKYIITQVTVKLTKRNHKISTNYGIIEAELHKKGITNPTIKNISDAVIAIRQSKLPDPKVLGNSGSFFKNPVISKNHFDQVISIHPEIPHYIVSDSEIKVPAGWLIEQAGFKGKRIGDAGVHEKQALVLVNYGNATGTEIYNLAKNIQKTILDTFGIEIEMEVNVF